MDMKHQDIDALFSGLIRSLKGAFSPEERRVLRLLVKHQAYGAALYQAIDLALQDGKTISATSFNLVTVLLGHAPFPKTSH
ncbi:MAG TPA: hypothetical protein VJS14_16085 [Enterobacteriaceae bacterium]|nr:hypothetical protein [Enterobacteriaceae bacterium]